MQNVSSEMWCNCSKKSQQQWMLGEMNNEGKTIRINETNKNAIKLFVTKPVFGLGEGWGGINTFYFMIGKN